MNKLLRTLLVLMVLTLTLSAVCFTSYADELDLVDPPQDLPAEEGSTDIIEDELSGIPPHITQFVKSMDENDVKVTINYTRDSAFSAGVYYEIGYDELTEQVYLELFTYLEEGYAIYDKDTTVYIDGIKINDTFLECDPYVYRYYLTDPTVSYTITVKTVYTDSFMGTLAKIQNGDASILDLFENPVLAMQVIYYAIAIVSLILSVILSRKVKTTKAKTSNEIAAAVAASNEESKVALITDVTNLILNNIAPMLDTCVKSNQNVVKAIALSNSKSKDAPLAILDVLATVSQADLTEVIEKLKTDISNAIASEDAERENTLSILHTIADNASVEETVNNTPSSESQRSIF